MRSLKFAVALLCLDAVSLHAQYTVKHVVFRGDSPYTQAQLQAASGIKPGDHLSAKALGEQAQVLMNTGVFDDLDASFEGPVQAIDVVFKTRPAQNTALLPVSFDNFVWFAPSELEDSLHARVPLYRKRLPQAGTVQTQVRDALQAMLDEKSAKVHVDALDTPSTDTEPETIHFRVTSPSVLLTTVKLSGLSSATAPALRASLATVVGKPYDEGTGPSLDDRLLAPFRNTGYLDASIQNLQRTPGLQPDGTIGVTITGNVTAGEIFHVSTLRYVPSEFYPADEFAKTEKLHDGDVASQSALEVTFAPVLAAYHQRGYVDARLDTHPQLDQQAHTVAYTLTLEPGQPYRVGKLAADGLSGQAQADYEAHWKMLPGSVYNPDYIRTFLRQNSALRSLFPYTAIFDARADPATHTVDVNVHFLKNNKG